MYADAEKGMIRLDFGAVTYRWPISKIGNVAIYSRSLPNSNFNTTENILRGAAIGGKTGAFLGAFEVSGPSPFILIEFVVNYRTKNQYYVFGENHWRFMPEEEQERIKMPRSNKVYGFVLAAMYGINAEIKKWYETHDEWKPEELKIREEQAQ